MATYAGEQPEHLAEALRSIAEQTLKPQQIVLVVDGPVPSRQAEVIARFAAEMPPLEVLRLPVNGGLAAALNAGLERCRYEFVARMDSDDVSRPERLQVQVSELVRSSLDVIAAWHSEFVDDVRRPVRVKRTPADHRAIVSALRRRNPISHPTIMFRRSVILEAGGYRSQWLLEDYDLYLRLAAHGGRFGAVQRPLVDVRVSHQHARRGGVRYLASHWSLRRNAFSRGDIGLLDFAIGMVGFAAVTLAPTGIRRMLYALVRSSPTDVSAHTGTPRSGS